METTPLWAVTVMLSPWNAQNIREQIAGTQKETMNFTIYNTMQGLLIHQANAVLKGDFEWEELEGANALMKGWVAG